MSYSARPATPPVPHPSDVHGDRPRVVIVGGGYTGAAVAVQLAHAVGDRIAITIVEPREDVGRGIAYSTRDPDHRLNGPLDNHLLDPAHADGLREWCAREGVFAEDPDAKAANGATYVRRGDFGGFVAAQVRALRARTDVVLRHHRALALGLERTARGTEVIASDGTRLAAELVVVATGNGAPRFPALFARIAGHPRAIENPFAAAALEALPARSRILLVGSGLTAMDVAATLLRHGKQHRIHAISRHGLMPAAHRKRVSDLSPTELLERIDGAIPDYARAALDAGRIRELSRGLRRRIADRVAEGGDWREPFDELRNVVWQVWPRFPTIEKRRFLRHLRLRYDTNRFRVPPQTEALIERAEHSAEVLFLAGRLTIVKANGASIGVAWHDRPTGRENGADYDAIVNCTGLDPDCGARSNPFLASLLAAGLVRRDGCGFGFAVDPQCRPFARDGSIPPGMRIVGPPSAGSHGDPLGVIFIAAQVRRTLPGMIGALGLGESRHRA